MSKAKEIPALVSVKLSDIVTSETNPRKEFDAESISGLAQSIKEKGVLQPIVIRKNGKPGKYELVCGERRYRASKIAGLAEIPATVRELTDEEAFELQITENLQRKDVHPLDEAVAFKSLMERKGETAKDVGLRFGKSEAFVVGRLKLNDLMPEFKKDFYAGKMLIGHAFLLARLTKEDQEKVKDEHIMDHKGNYATVKELEEVIEQEVMNNLSAVAFKKDDETLLPKAGSCTACPKRSGNNPSLFPDIKEKDRCFDSTCFNLKRETFVRREVQDILNNRPEVLLLKSSYCEADEDIMKMISEMKVKVHKEYSDFRECEKKDKGAMKGFYIAGNEEGKYQYVQLYSGKKGTVSERVAENPAEVQIQGIKQRQERARELDEEKIYARVLEEFGKKNEGKPKTKMNDPEEAAMWWMLVDKLRWDEQEKVVKMLGFKNQEDFSEPKKFDTVYKRLLKLSPEEMSLIVRKTFHHSYGANDPDSMYAQLINKMVEAQGVPIAQFRKEQQEIADKREARAKERIAALKE